MAAAAAAAAASEVKTPRLVTPPLSPYAAPGVGFFKAVRHISPLASTRSYLEYWQSRACDCAPPSPVSFGIGKVSQDYCELCKRAIHCIDHNPRDQKCSCEAPGASDRHATEAERLKCKRLQRSPSVNRTPERKTPAAVAASASPSPGGGGGAASSPLKWGIGDDQPVLTSQRLLVFGSAPLSSPPPSFRRPSLKRSITHPGAVGAIAPSPPLPASSKMARTLFGSARIVNMQMSPSPAPSQEEANVEASPEEPELLLPPPLSPSTTPPTTPVSSAEGGLMDCSP